MKFKPTLTILLLAATCHAEEPLLPAGLGSGEPALPVGLESNEPVLPTGLEVTEPVLPPGLSNEPPEPVIAADDKDGPLDGIDWTPHGFLEARAGTWTHGNPVEPEASLAELRWQVDLGAHYNSVSARMTADFLADAMADDHSIDFRRGEGWLDLRELWISSPLTDWMDIKAGRQISTWGTGDYIFINDLFPKDWRSFLLGRDDEYLKAPSEALRVNLYGAIANLDIVYTPIFAPDRFIGADRLSYYSDETGVIGGEDQLVNVDIPDSGEVAARLHRLIGDAEAALYFYHGFWKSPAGQNQAGNAAFPELTVTGGSVRKPVAGGIAKAEFGYYHSNDDTDGNDPNVRNSEIRALVGYEHELASQLTGSIQWYVEHMMDYDTYMDNLPSGSSAREEDRHLLTLQLTKLLMMQDLRLSIFAFYSPTDDDVYLRPNANYKINDQWQATVGANIYEGAHDHTFFGQFEENTNFYFSARYSY